MVMKTVLPILLIFAICLHQSPGVQAQALTTTGFDLWSILLNFDFITKLASAITRGDILQIPQAFLEAVPQGGLIGIIAKILKTVISYVHPVFNSVFRIAGPDGIIPEDLPLVAQLRYIALKLFGTTKSLLFGS